MARVCLADNRSCAGAWRHAVPRCWERSWKRRTASFELRVIQAASLVIVADELVVESRIGLIERQVHPKADRSEDRDGGAVWYSGHVRRHFARGERGARRFKSGAIWP